MVVEKSQLSIVGCVIIEGCFLLSCLWVKGGSPFKMVFTKYDFFFVFLKKVVWRSSSALGLLLGSLFKQLAIISWKAREYLCTPETRSSVGGASWTMCNSTLWGFSRERGGRPWVSSSAVIPKDQMSADASYCFPFITSGAIQQGVPTNDLRLPSVRGLWGW